ncbi:Serpentine receptor class epsilon-33 [Aphelenchoides bicaudatus]|nr:Serpentine receptor class epsilon-33 [Aphelenchoides bicaudatus]
MLRVGCGYASIFSVGMIIFERLIATANVGSYEKNTHPVLVCIVICTIWLFGIISSIFAYGKAYASSFTIVGLFAALVFVVVGYRFAIETNKLKLMQSKTSSFQYTLSQKFQIKENLRTIKIVKKCAKTFLPFAIFIGVIWCTVALLYWKYKTGPLYYTMRETSHLASCIGSLFILYACSNSTHVWRENMKEQLRIIFQPFRNKKGRKTDKIKPKAALINSDGKQIGGFGVHQEKQIYFIQMEALWNKQAPA